MLKSRGAILALGTVLGLVIGLNLVGWWPQIPVHATATHGQENFAMCTGPVDTDLEAVYLLDYLTGDLKAMTVSNQNGSFNSGFTRNVAKDFGLAGAKNPKFLMTTGIADVRRGAQNAQPSKALLYVTEVVSAQVAVYAIPWSPQAHSAGKQQGGELTLLDTFNFRGGAGATPVPAKGKGKGKK